MKRNIDLLGVPLYFGADRRGVEMGPSAIRCAGLIQRLEQAGYHIHDRGDLKIPPFQSIHHPTPNLKYLDQIVSINQQVRQAVVDTLLKGSFPLMIGGDHSLSIGSLAGIAQQYQKLGLIWYDAHGDLNTAQTTPSGNIHGMSLAVALGQGDPALRSLFGQHDAISAKHVVLIGTRSLDPGERDLIKKLGIRLFTMYDIERWGMAKIMEWALDIAAEGTDGVHLSLDLDALDPNEAPGVGTPVPGGIYLRESLLSMHLLHQANVLKSAEFVEVNCALDKLNQTAEVCVALISSLFGEQNHS